MRLRADFDISSFSASNQVILTALKKYGMILADNGSAVYISGAPDSRWDNDDLHNLGSITASDFEIIAMKPIYTDANLPSGAPPSIENFSANSPTIARGKPVTLSWSASNAIYASVSPTVGPVCGTSVMVNPKSTTTYTLYLSNQYGGSTASVRVKVKPR